MITSFPTGICIIQWFTNHYLNVPLSYNCTATECLYEDKSEFLKPFKVRLYVSEALPQAHRQVFRSEDEIVGAHYLKHLTYRAIKTSVVSI